MAEQARKTFEPRVLPTEAAVGAFQLAALRETAAAKPDGALLGGHGAQHCYSLLCALADATPPPTRSSHASSCTARTRSCPCPLTAA